LGSTKAVVVVAAAVILRWDEDKDVVLAPAASSAMVLRFVGPKQRRTAVMSPMSKNPKGFCDVEDL
jgi:hypothetical protein